MQTGAWLGRNAVSDTADVGITFGVDVGSVAVIEAERSVLKLSFYKLRRGLVSGRVSVPNIVLNEVILAA